MEPNGGSTPRHPMAFPHCAARSPSSASRTAPAFSTANFVRSIRKAASFSKGSAGVVEAVGTTQRDVAVMSPCRSSPEPGFAGRGASCDDQRTRRRRSTGESEDVGRRSGVPGKTMMTRNKDDARKEDAAHRARLVTARLLQWRFANARLEKTMARVTFAAQRRCLSHRRPPAPCLRRRRPVLSAAASLGRRLRKIKLGRLLRPHLPLLGTWEPIGESHADAVADLCRVLSASSTSLPLTDGAQAGPELLHETMFACVRTLDEIAASADIFYATGGVTSSSVGALARTMRQDISGLEEVMRLRRIVTSLKVQEVSLRANLIQAKQQRDTAGIRTWGYDRVPS
ncbi:unnamed protein product [Alopecurus aequalis]